MDNNKFANLIVAKRMATVEQIKGLWPYLSPSKDIGMLLVENGILPQVIYEKMIDFLGSGNRDAVPPVIRDTGTSSGIPNDRQPSVGNTSGREASVALPEQGAQPRNQTPGESSLQPLSVHRSLGEMFRYAREIDASDIHLSPNAPVIVRRYGMLEKVTGEVMSPPIIQERVLSILSADQREVFEKQGDLEFVYTLSGGGRFRVTLMKQRSGWDCTARCIPASLRSFEETGMPQSCHTLTQWAQGLVLITGPACCGKTSTLSTLIEMINQTRTDHIITLESPIEYIFKSKSAQVTQREIGKDSVNQEAALRAALREDPDIIVVGELRDLSTIQLAVSAAETGHLVFATMNTISASRTIYRLIDSFPPEEQGIMRNMISESLRGVISQQLIRRKDGSGMVAAFEVLIVNSAVANMIRKDEAHQLGTAMITGKSVGMQLLDDSLSALAGRGIIAEEEVAARSITKSPLTAR